MSDPPHGSTEQAGSVERHPPDEVFALLGNETRMSILQAFGETTDEPLSFSTLRERVGMRDSGKFNYHLGKLTGHFVRKDEKGYELTLAGRQLVGALLAGTYTASATIDPIPLDSPCPQCGGTIVTEYTDELVEMRCTDCEEWYSVFSFPPGALDEFDQEELPAAFDRWMWTLMEHIHMGFCRNCSGRLTGRLVETDDHPEGVRIEYRCGRCGELATFSAVTALYFHPEGVCFFHDHGVNLRETPLWEIAARSDHTVDVLATDPPSATVTVTVDGDALAATLTHDLELRDVSRDRQS